MCLLPLASGPSRRVGCPCKQHPVGPTQGQGRVSRFAPQSEEGGSTFPLLYVQSREAAALCFLLVMFTLLFSCPLINAHGCQLRGRHTFSPDAAAGLLAAANLVESDVSASFPGAGLPPCHQLPRVETARD